MSKRRISILGSTGSVGRSTIDLIKRSPDEFKVVALSANKNFKLLAEQAKLLRPEFIALGDENLYADLKNLFGHMNIKSEIACGEQAIIDAASIPADWIMAAIIGAAGLKPTLAAIKQGGIVAFANKECLVCAGDLVMNAVRQYKTTMLPVDSEHNAIFQVFSDQQRQSIDRLILTASGGPFSTKDMDFMAKVTPAQAVAHPNWDMGAKISVDSATMMNKGFEIIEARYLFDMPDDKIDVLIHPQSIIHSMVEYCDGSILAQMGVPDMRVPIAYCLAWPNRMQSPCEKLDFAKLGQMEFNDPDLIKFPAINLVRHALAMGSGATTILNAANEIAVAAFLTEKISFLDIVTIVEDILSKSISNINNRHNLNALDDIIALDQKTRSITLELIQQKKI